MSSTYEAWSSSRPVYQRLPGINGGYYSEDGNNPADWLTQFVDVLLVETKAKIDDLPRQLNPDTCDPEWLDFLAGLCGLTGEYWDTAWPESIQRSLIRSAFPTLWANKGSKQVIEYLLNLFGISHDIWLGSAAYADIALADIATVGTPQWRYVIRLPLLYLRDSPEFKLAEKLNRLYGPVFCDSRVCFKEAYADFAVCGDPVFS